MSESELEEQSFDESERMDLVENNLDELSDSEKNDLDNDVVEEPKKSKKQKSKPTIVKENIKEDKEDSGDEWSPNKNKEEEKKSKEEAKKEVYEQTKKENEELTAKWKETLRNNEVIDEPEYFQMKHYIKMAVNKDEYGTIICSRGGTGKTHTTLSYLSKENIDFAYLNSFSTPMAYYIWSYKNRKKVKVVDDVHKLLESDKFSPFLKAQLEGFNGKRVVFYGSSKNPEDRDGIYPLSFEEEGSIIILTNRINEKNMHIDAILSRVPRCDLDISNSRMLELMETIAKTPFKGLSVKENMEVLEFCKDKLKNSLDLNLRTFNHARNFFNYAKKQESSEGKRKELWQRLITQSLKKDDTDLVIMQVLTDDKYANDEERIEAINQQLVKKISRPTFYRRKKELIDSTKKEESKEN